MVSALDHFHDWRQSADSIPVLRLARNATIERWRDPEQRPCRTRKVSPDLTVFGHDNFAVWARARIRLPVENAKATIFQREASHSLIPGFGERYKTLD
jgi:hypothetical protein